MIEPKFKDSIKGHWFDGTVVHEVPLGVVIMRTDSTYVPSGFYYMSNRVLDDDEIKQLTRAIAAREGIDLCTE